VVGGGAAGRQGLGVSVSDAVTAPALAVDEACEADMWQEQLSDLSHGFTMERNGVGPEQTLMSLCWHCVLLLYYIH